jgi:proteasome lid subunit RPN8/RPN11
MLHGLLRQARWMLGDFQRTLRCASLPARPVSRPAALPRHGPLQRLVLTDGVGRTLFEEYAGHRAGARGAEETGWVLLGLREGRQAVALATLPAGANRDASVAHVRFDSGAQALASRIVRQLDRRLTILGVVHTHPGSLCRPSGGDLRGDRRWVKRLRGQEGVFGIGTADVPVAAPPRYGHQPSSHVQCLGPLRFCWYALRQGDRGYRPLPVELTFGPDLAGTLRLAWPTLEAYAGPLDRLCQQQAGLRVDVVEGSAPAGLVVTLPLAGPDRALRVLLEPGRPRYFVERPGEWLEVDRAPDRVDRGVYLLLAELAALP